MHEAIPVARMERFRINHLCPCAQFKAYSTKIMLEYDPVCAACTGPGKMRDYEILLYSQKARATPNVGSSKWRLQYKVLLRVRCFLFSSLPSQLVVSSETI